MSSTSFVQERRLSAFLELAPTTSNSYPQVQRSQQTQPAQQQAQQPKADLTAATLAEAAAPDANQELLKQRRSSSLSSAGAAANGRFLKLGPVHWGEHMEEHQGDFAVE